MADLPEILDEPATEIDLGPLPMLMGYALRRAQLMMFEDFHARFAGEDIRPAQYSVLKVLELNPGLRQNQVSAALGIQRSNFGPMFDLLEQRGLVERRRPDGDRRAFALFLTEGGAAMVARLDRLVEAHEAKFVARIGGDGKVKLRTLLFQLAQE